MRTSKAVLCLVASIHLIAGLISGSASATDQPLVLERTILLENVAGRIDHMAVDSVGKRLFVAELGNGSVDVVDLQTGKVVHRISGLEAPQGIAYLAGLDLLVIANGGDGSVRFFHAGDLSPSGVIVLGDDADNIRVDPHTGYVLVGYGNGGLAIVDPTTRSKVGEIPLAGHPESFQLDPNTDRVFANVPDARQIVVADRKLHKQVAGWKTPGLSGNFPMAIDGTTGQLAIVFRSPAKLALWDLATGATTENVDTCRDADDLFFDDKRNRIYVSCGEGAIDVVQRRREGLRIAGHVTTSSGARTSLFAPELDRLFVAARAGSLGSGAAILVFHPSP
ncbi:WD40 repeat domain-containing protein [Rhizobium leguminosarum]|uniref:WD40 repeat domain-containing protein n=1 Tax=Rhizobium leguminosarum TaxID=384 RepID=UPI00041EF3D2|nr:WD40 repeat domain-containing protein [Rhizobium leguminosarum]